MIVTVILKMKGHIGGQKGFLHIINRCYKMFLSCLALLFRKGSLSINKEYGLTEKNFHKGT